MSPYCLGHELIACRAVLPQHGKLFHPWTSCIGLVPAVLCEISKVDDATLISADQDPCASCSGEMQYPGPGTQQIICFHERALDRDNSSQLKSSGPCIDERRFRNGTESLSVLLNTQELADCGKPLHFGVRMCVLGLSYK
ncbi:unnamed protein product [Fusarium graminearum]|uniref:Chromosome 3, complete genome n=1 Tax=Gibberella zeae (strain ATCC MYA-4620 / CBS 123657 / FGSC 9075 / NRRL 31084 / PH-1) TaxID=229533 RepID=I1S7Q2_GIBZE|nr:hypothetical protein FGSG_12877 [Fusarium graminearum PH-1]ESU12218.1 hypothetical protein FGSG_12877 [Fusarium graminearum PH-1]CEF86511.1 unnamed protein product [Fusarium graminearum]CZS84918.1 unnamed protein product [Fusarium graminearum]|eukprot:XP_011324794.1 hypothetical protein FGSG_12877 [Fusarium graminearum PH-1]